MKKKKLFQSTLIGNEKQKHSPSHLHFPQKKKQNKINYRQGVGIIFFPRERMENKIKNKKKDLGHSI